MKIFKRISMVLAACALTYLCGFLIAPPLFAHGSRSAFEVGMLCYMAIFFGWMWVLILWNKE